MAAKNLDGMEFSITSANLESSYNLSEQTQWKYKSGDSLIWANPNYSDDSWEKIDPRIPDQNVLNNNWKGVGWFRIKIVIDSSLINEAIGFTYYQTGVSRIYINGRFIRQIGNYTESNEEEPRFNRDPIPLTELKPGKHLIAVRYTNNEMEYFHNYGYFGGFHFVLGKLENLTNTRNTNISKNTFKESVMITIPLLLAILHLFLYLFNRKIKQNLWYVLFLLFFVFFAFVSYHDYFVSDPFIITYFYRLGLFSLLFTVFFGSAAIYSNFKPVPKYYIYFALVSLIASIISFIKPNAPLFYFSYAFISVIFFPAGSVVGSDRKTSEGVNIIFIGFMILAISGIYQVFISLDWLPVILGLYDIFAYGVIGFIIFMSISLAKDFAATSKNLEKKLVEVKELSQKALEQERKAREEEIQRRVIAEDNKRKTRELEEARDLQLSMLPKKLPELPNLEITAFMKTATEVGGDYYDYKRTNGELTAVIGDATGHGTKAGTLVAAVKSLFGAFGEDMEITAFFKRSTKVIKSMNLGNLFMSLSMIKIDSDNHFVYSSAGMPQALIYRAESEAIEEILLKSMPLGSFTEFPYQTIENKLNKGDVILLLSDGFIEQFNEDKEMLGLERTKEIFKDSAEKPPREIVDILMDEGDKWRNNAVQNDDITFMVLKAKQ
jgi:serine phosphatase RsbU (regulator of sigma subunit)